MKDDTISRAAAIDALNDVLADYIPGLIGRDEEIPLKCAVVIRNLPSAQRWIPCKERLPEDYTDVLVWFEYYRYGDYNRLYQMHGIGNYMSEYDSWMINHETGWRKLRVFAWMPLPSPWKGEKE